MTPVDASNNPDKVRCSISETASQIKSTKTTPKHKMAIMLEMRINVISSLRDTFLIGIENCLKLMKF